MIQAVEIINFRGIAKGEIADLTPLTILVGPNGAGKSTILEALLIGASANPHEALAQVLRERPPTPTPRWMFWGGNVDKSLIRVSNFQNEVRATALVLDQPKHPRSNVSLAFVGQDGGVSGHHPIPDLKG